MSCTVVAVPYALMWVVGAIASAAVAAANNTEENQNLKELTEMYNEAENCTEDHVITDKHFIEKTFETPFMDKSILLKTLEEHGVKNIYKWETGLSGEVDNYKLVFEKEADDKPYSVRISCLEYDKAEEKVGDLNSEYALNVQEDAYLHILDKLNENNMHI